MGKVKSKIMEGDGIQKQGIEAPADGVVREHQLSGDDQTIAEQAQQVQQAAADTHRVEVLVAVNGHHAHDKLTVATDHPFYSGLIDQNLARVMG